jgi:ribosomal-protein-alanine N-acetyltransferase
MTPSVFVRLVCESDLPALVRLDTLSNPHPWGESLIADALQSRKNWLVETVETFDGKTKVLAWLTASQCLDQSELELIVVDVSARRQGLAKMLISAWREFVVENGANELLLEVRESNDGAIGLYQSLGFEEVGRRKNYYQTEQGHEAACLFTLKM